MHRKTVYIFTSYTSLALKSIGIFVIYADITKATFIMETITQRSD